MNTLLYEKYLGSAISICFIFITKAILQQARSDQVKHKIPPNNLTPCTEFKKYE